jgi:hypothetical protein
MNVKANLVIALPTIASIVGLVVCASMAWSG